MGLGLQITELTEENLFNALNAVLEEDFKRTALEVSRRFKDRMVSPLESAVYWIEYVLRHNGADFLRSPRRNLHWYQIYFVDFFALVLLLLFVFVKVVRVIVGLLFKRSSGKVKKN